MENRMVLCEDDMKDLSEKVKAIYNKDTLSSKISDDDYKDILKRVKMKNKHVIKESKCNLISI